MKKTILYILLMISSVILSACSAEKKVVSSREVHIDSPYVISFDADGYHWSIPPRWLYTENSKFAAGRWQTGIEQDLYFSPKCFVETEFNRQDMEHMRDLCFQNLMDSVSLIRSMTDFQIPDEWSGRLCDYVAFVEYDKTDIDDNLADTASGLMPENMHRGTIENIIGRLVVTAVITSVGDECCNIPVKLLEQKLSEATYNPLRDGLFLYLAQESNDLYVFHGSAFLPKFS